MNDQLIFARLDAIDRGIERLLRVLCAESRPLPELEPTDNDFMRRKRAALEAREKNLQKRQAKEARL